MACEGMSQMGDHPGIKTIALDRPCLSEDLNSSPSETFSILFTTVRVWRKTREGLETPRSVRQQSPSADRKEILLMVIQKILNYHP